MSMSDNNNYDETFDELIVSDEEIKEIETLINELDKIK
jgi:hypothetical protein